MAASNWDAALKDLLRHEGGNDDDPRDPGGRTSRGIIQWEYDRYRDSKGKPRRDVWMADQAEVVDIYRTEYWAALRCDDLPSGVDYCTFDFGVNSGIVLSVKALQNAVGAEDDGKVGPETIALAKQADAKDLIDDICDERMELLKSLSTWRTFGRGWTTRVSDVRALAKQMADQASPAPAGRSLLQAIIDFLVGFLPKKAAPPKPLDLAGRIVRAMKVRGYKLDTAPGEVNIVYVEGMEPDGTKNDNAPDKWNDLRCVIGFDGDTPVMRGIWKATTEPGKYYGEQHIINPKGAAHIEFGQYPAWRVGFHRNDMNRPALVQTGGPVKVRRTRDMTRQGPLDTGYFGINQHDGQNGDPESIGSHSAGCLVVRSVAQHAEFMKLVKSDPRYVVARGFVFSTTIMPASEI